jgi:hypothetical protein
MKKIQISTSNRRVFSNSLMKPPSGSLNLILYQIPRLNSTLPSLLHALQIGRTSPQNHLCTFSCIAFQPQRQILPSPTYLVYVKTYLSSTFSPLCQGSSIGCQLWLPVHQMARLSGSLGAISGTQCWLTSRKSSELQMGCSWILQSKMLKTWWNLLPKSGGTWFLDQRLFQSIIGVPCDWFSIHYSTVVLHHWLISQVELAEPQMEPTHGHTCLSPRPPKIL